MKILFLLLLSYNLVCIIALSAKTQTAYNCRVETCITLETYLWSHHHDTSADIPYYDQVTTEDDTKSTLVYEEASAGQSKEDDKISMLPGQPANVNFTQYSGYITVDPMAGRALFYYFAESEQDSSTKPLVLWLNGGPGCSSLGAGAMMELGPFRVNKDGKTLSHNPNAWNKVANVIFVESPAGVGFSYSNRSSDYVTGDKNTAFDTLAFLVNWLERFPEYKGREFYITGESYAGHYVPQLATIILRYNIFMNQTSAINLKGIAIGNAYVDYEDQRRGIFQFWWKHAMISDPVYQGVVQNCNFSFGAHPSSACRHYQMQAFEAKGRVFPYNIYEPFCASLNYTPSPASSLDPCSNNYVFGYLNRPEVQKELHANVTGGIHGPWDLCNYNIVWKDSPVTMLPVIKQLMGSGIRIWLYSGDTDSVVPITSTMFSFRKLNAIVTTPWYAWYLNGEVGGYVTGYENITLVTVKGAGHFVPGYQPERALTIFSTFLAGKLPTNSSHH